MTQTEAGWYSYPILLHFHAMLSPPPPCASTAAVPKVQAKQRFKAHPVFREARACAHTHDSKARYLTAMLRRTATLAMAENHINTNSMGLNVRYNVVTNRMHSHRHE